MALRLPLSVATGGLAVLPDGSVAEIAQSVRVLLSTRIGERASEPEYGSRSDLFFGPDMPLLDQASINTWEPRAAGVVSIELTDGSTP